MLEDIMVGTKGAMMEPGKTEWRSRMELREQNSMYLISKAGVI